jgi:hypothetical protein
MKASKQNKRTTERPNAKKRLTIVNGEPVNLASTKLAWLKGYDLHTQMFILAGMVVN